MANPMNKAYYLYFNCSKPHQFIINKSPAYVPDDSINIQAVTALVPVPKI